MCGAREREKEKTIRTFWILLPALDPLFAFADCRGEVFNATPDATLASLRYRSIGRFIVLDFHRYELEK